MSSRLTEIYAAVAAMPVRYDGAVVAVRNLDALPNSLTSEALPVRLLQPMDMKAENRGMSIVTLGTPAVVTADWKLVDQLFARPAAQVDRISNIAALLVEYQAAYLEQVRTLKFPKPIVATVTSVGMEVDVWPYGAQGTMYFGVRVTLGIKEIVQ